MISPTALAVMWFVSGVLFAFATVYTLIQYRQDDDPVSYDLFWLLFSLTAGSWCATWGVLLEPSPIRELILMLGRVAFFTAAVNAPIIVVRRYRKQNGPNTLDQEIHDTKCRMGLIKDPIGDGKV